MELYGQVEKVFLVGIVDKQVVFEEDLKLDMCFVEIVFGIWLEFLCCVFKYVFGCEEFLDMLCVFFNW